MTTESIDFGSTLLGSPCDKSVALKNCGARDITYTISGLDAPFSTTVTTGTLAAKAQDLTISVNFDPTETGVFEDDLVITFASETRLEPITVHVTGKGSEAVCDGTDKNNFVPIYGWTYEYRQINQMIYPASYLAAIGSKRIASITFYSPEIKFSGGRYNVSVGLTDQETFAESPTRIYKVVLSGGGDFPDILEIGFRKPLPKNEIALLDDDSQSAQQNADIISGAAGDGMVYDVTLTDRTLYKDGNWNTLCLPFDVTAEQLAANTQFAGATLMTLDVTQQNGFDAEDGTLYLSFKTATAIEAGVPYLVKWVKAADYDANPSAYDIVNPLFESAARRLRPWRVRPMDWNRCRWWAATRPSA